MAQSKPGDRLAQSVETSTLCQIYGGLLTEKQRTAIRLHYDEDWSLGEIAEELGVTRQNVHELIARTTLKLERYEAVLHCAAQAAHTAEALRGALGALEGADPAQAKALLKQCLSDIEEPDGEEAREDGI